MKLPADFYENLPEKTDKDLYDMVAHADDYLPEALEAARKELRRRDLAPERVAALEAVTQATVAEEQRKADQPLGWPMRILLLVGVCSSILIPLYYERKGLKRKARESWIWMGYSCALWFGVGILLYLFGH